MSHILSAKDEDKVPTPPSLPSPPSPPSPPDIPLAFDNYHDEKDQMSQQVNAAMKKIWGPFFSTEIERGVPSETIKGAALSASLTTVFLLGVNPLSIPVVAAAAVSGAYVAVTPGPGGSAMRSLGRLSWVLQKNLVSLVEKQVGLKKVSVDDDKDLGKILKEARNAVNLANKEIKQETPQAKAKRITEHTRIKAEEETRKEQEELEKQRAEVKTKEEVKLAEEEEEKLAAVKAEEETRKEQEELEKQRAKMKAKEDEEEESFAVVKAEEEARKEKDELEKQRAEMKAKEAAVKLLDEEAKLLEEEEERLAAVKAEEETRKEQEELERQRADVKAKEEAKLAEEEARLAEEEERLAAEEEERLAAEEEDDEELNDKDDDVVIDEDDWEESIQLAQSLDGNKEKSNGDNEQWKEAQDLAKKLALESNDEEITEKTEDQAMEDLGRAARAAVEKFEAQMKQDSEMKDKLLQKQHQQQEEIPHVVENNNAVDFESMKVTELKDELRSRGLKVSGRKGELIERLKEFTLS
eukprot:CAMPEP_0197840174 /NCGR_PEP_ID=MMETSP1437-20131217/45451_1 /TAXON_ID=49252 ORGANISM="Eucampia antarctica, Strain CCMP1452" /NCGR_SAMPLE_ID=MMETSP1437 /ASSEMBLY_ACC=CAM_ASM_001096 /LENGTH=524 /DNA_ID=CAMNT_0043449737 /DNA_START=128 /DNA_END=1702 /DNA_ORIENTATION=-